MVMAGGEGMRLRPLTLGKPKPMLPVANRPLLEYALLHLSSSGYTSIILTLHYLSEKIAGYFGDGSRLGLKLSYSLEDAPLGTAGGVRKAVNELGLEGGRVLVWSGDILSAPSLSEMMEAHKRSGAPLTMAVTRVEEPSRYGVVDVDEEGWVRNFVEKPAPGEAASNLINAGIYLIEPEALNLIPPNKSFDFARDLFPLLLKRGDPIFTWPINGYWSDIGSPESYLDANHAVLEGLVEGFRPPGKEVEAGVWVEGGDVPGHVSLNPPVAIAPGVILGKEAELGPRAALGPRSRVGRRAWVEESVLWSEVELETGVVVKRAVIPDGCAIGPGRRLEKTVVEPGARLP